MKAIAHRLTAQIVIAMVLAFLIGFLCRYLPGQTTWQPVVFQDLIGTLGQLFVRLIKMLVVPIVLVFWDLGFLPMNHSPRSLIRVCHPADLVVVILHLHPHQIQTVVDLHRLIVLIR